MILQQEGRVEQFLNLEFFLDMIEEGPTKRDLCSYGRISNMINMAGVVLNLSDDPDTEPRPISKFQPTHWTRFLDSLSECRDTLLRKDATVLRYPILREPFLNDNENDQPSKEDARVNEELACTALFQQEYNDTVKVCLVQKVLCSVKPYIDGEEALGRSMVHSTLSAIDQHFPNKDSYRQHLLSLFETDIHGEPVPELISLYKIRKILRHRKDLSLERCIKKCNQLIQSWYLTVFQNHLPVCESQRPTVVVNRLLPLDDGRVPFSPVESSHPAARDKNFITPTVPRTRDRRRVLKESTGKKRSSQSDNTPPSQQKLKRSHKSSTKSRKSESVEDSKKVKKRKPDVDNSLILYKYTCSGGDDSSGDDEESSTKRFRPKLTSPDFSGFMVDLPRPKQVKEAAVISSPSRRRWTKEETDCIMVGVSKCGEGQWRKIKDMFPELLQHRTNVQIKDRWRTIQSNKEE